MVEKTQTYTIRGTSIDKHGLVWRRKCTEVREEDTKKTHEGARTMLVVQYDEWLVPFLALCVHPNPELMTLTRPGASTRFVTRPTQEIQVPAEHFLCGTLSPRSW